MLLTNVDRTTKNTNMLMWHKELRLIDHGISFFFQHLRANWYKRAASPSTQIKDHVLLLQTDKLEGVDAEFRVSLTSEKVREIVSLIPDDWVEWYDKNEAPQDIHDIYYQLLIERIEHSGTLAREVRHAREAHL